MPRYPPEGLIKTAEGKRQITSVKIEAVKCEKRTWYRLNRKQESKRLTAERCFQWLMFTTPEILNCEHVEHMNLNFTRFQKCNPNAFFTILHIHTSLQHWRGFVVHGRFQVVAPCTVLWGPAVWGEGRGQIFWLCVRFLSNVFCM